MNKLKEGLYCIYLRKSRADIEQERIGEYETLNKHLQILQELADKYGLKVIRIYKELVSGDTIADRPEIQKLLEEVRSGIYAGVLCTEVSRLARGNTKDQGEVAEAFASTGTLIVTPSKVYDPQDEADSTFFDFELFMARQEFKYIKKRLKAGKLASMRAGNWLQSFAPTGYDKAGKTLVPNKYAPAVQHILYGYADGSMGMADCVRYLRSQGLEKASTTTVRYMLTNLAYAGYLQLGINPLRTVKGRDGKLHTYRVKEKTGEVVKGNWDGLVPLETMQKCKAMLTNAPKVKIGHDMHNIFAGLLRCERCGRTLIRESPSKGHHHAVLRHPHGVDRPDCRCSSSRYEDIVKEIQQFLADTLPDITVTERATKRKAISTASIEGKLRKARQAREGLYDKLETGLYTAEEYRQRAAKWDAEIQALEDALQQAADANAYHMTAKERKASTKDLIRLLDTPNEKVELTNRALKLLIDHITYWRDSPKDEPRMVVTFRQ